MGVSVIAVLALNGTIRLKSENVYNNSEINAKEDFDYSNFVGEYVDDSNKSLNDIRNNGGVILKIYTVSETDITFEIETISSNERVAFFAKEDIELTFIRDGIYNFN